MRRWIFAMLASLAVTAPVAAMAQEATPVSGDPEAAYCEQVGGTVRERTPMYGTNNPTSQFPLGSPVRFCEFTGGEGADPPESFIMVDLDTLYSEEPTLAALAYLTMPPLPDTSGGGNPASIYCSSLGGAEIGSSTGAGGGWEIEDRTAQIVVLQACVFGDGSIIDSWGIAYHTNGTIRGADLTHLFRYQSDAPPLVFPGQ
jgi:putative hemolysin